MGKLKDVLTYYVVESPGGRAFFTVLSNIVASVFSSSFVTEITTANGLAWKLFHKTTSFYALLGVACFIFLHVRLMYNHDTSVRAFSDTEYCIAYMRSKCLPEAAAKAKRMIREGNGGELKAA